MTPPVAELHVHLEGTLEPELIMALAERNGIELPYADVDDLRARYEFTDLQSFLDLYYANMAALRTEEDFAAMTAAHVERAAAGGVRHAEVFFDPQAHVGRGVPLEAALRGVSSVLTDSTSRYGVSTELIVCFLRDLGGDAALECFDAVVETGIPFLGVGLDSAEVGFPPSAFAPVFAKARAAGLVGVAHAGEEGPPEYVWEALEHLQVTRIDHGIRSMEDDALVDRLLRLRAVASLAEHPIAEMLARGLAVTINSDDPAYFGGYVDDNFAAIIAGHSLSTAQVARLARNSFEASFLPSPRKAELLAEVDAWEAS
jgi:adenosine deaminase